MQYMLLVYLDENAMNETERERCYGESVQLTQDLNANGQFLAASPLHSVATATSVRMRDGKRLVTDGPFAETREQLGGYYVIETDDEALALEAAARCPGARRGAIELRPVMVMDTAPA